MFSVIFQRIKVLCLSFIHFSNKYLIKCSIKAWYITKIGMSSLNSTMYKWLIIFLSDTCKSMWL